MTKTEITKAIKTTGVKASVGSGRNQFLVTVYNLADQPVVLDALATAGIDATLGSDGYIRIAR